MRVRLRPELCFSLVVPAGSGQDLAECWTLEGSAAAAVADGASVVETEKDWVGLDSIGAAQTVLSRARKYFPIAAASSSPLEAARVMIESVRGSVSPSEALPPGGLMGRLGSLMGRFAGFVSRILSGGPGRFATGTTLALSMAGESFGALMLVAGDSAAVIGLCKPVSPQQSASTALAGVSLIGSPLLSSATMVRIRYTRVERGGVRGEAESWPFVAAIPRESLASAYASGYRWLVLAAASDGVNLGGQIVGVARLPTERGNLPLLAINRALHDALASVDEGLSDALKRMVVTWPRTAMETSIAHILAYAACLGAETGRPGLAREVARSLLEAKEADWLVTHDDRSVSLALLRLHTEAEAGGGEHERRGPAEPTRVQGASEKA